MDQKGIWKKVEPRDAQFMALTKMVDTMKRNKSLAFMEMVAQSYQLMLKMLGKTRQITTTLSMVLLVGESRTSDRPKFLIARPITGALIM